MEELCGLPIADMTPEQLYAFNYHWPMEDPQWLVETLETGVPDLKFNVLKHYADPRKTKVVIQVGI